jgi:hypothetical protein
MAGEARRQRALVHPCIMADNRIATESWSARVGNPIGSWDGFTQLKAERFGASNWKGKI